MASTVLVMVALGMSNHVDTSFCWYRLLHLAAHRVASCLHIGPCISNIAGRLLWRFISTI